MDSEAVVFIVANDPKAHRALVARIKSLQLSLEAYHSVDELFKAHPQPSGGCVLLDSSRSILDLNFLHQLRERAEHLPVVVISNAKDVPTAVRAMKLGAMDFLLTDCSDGQLCSVLESAYRWEVEHRRHYSRLENIRRRTDRLTAGHRQVLDLLVWGMSNREIAEELDLSVRAIEVRRSKIMRTMRAKSLAELVRLALLADPARLETLGSTSERTKTGRSPAPLRPR